MCFFCSNDFLNLRRFPSDKDSVAKGLAQLQEQLRIAAKQLEAFLGKRKVCFFWCEVVCIFLEFFFNVVCCLEFMVVFSNLLMFIGCLWHVIFLIIFILGFSRTDIYSRVF